MRLDVLHLDPVCAAEGLERADLVAHEGLDLVGFERERTPAEIEEVGIPGLSANCHTGTPACGHRHLHHPEIAGVEAAGEIGAGDVGDQALVVAELPRPEALAKIGVEVHLADMLAAARVAADGRIGS